MNSTAHRPVEITLDAGTASRRVARDAIAYLCRSADLAERDCLGLALAFGSALQFVDRACGAPVRCAVARRAGEVRVRVWSAAAPRRRIPRASSDALLRALRRKVHRADWTRRARPSAPLHLLLVQKRGRPQS